jgi:hypothetical protein
MSQHRLARRTFLQGMGLSVGLPLLEAMVPQQALGSQPPGQPPVRIAFVFFPNGAIMPSWTPKAEGESFEFTPTLKPLEPFRSRITVVSGLAQDNGRAKGDGPGDHARSAASYLTGAHPYKTSGANIRVGVSVDQVAADRVGHLTRLPSLELGIEAGRNAGNCDSGYSCAYSSNVSWKTESTPMAKEIHPRLVFERLFGSSSPSSQSSQGREQRDVLRKSILDFVTEDAERLKDRLGQADRRKLDEYFTSVRELEQRIERVEQNARQQRPDFEVPEAIPRDTREHVRLMYDLLVLAFRTDSTRVATFMLANAGSNRSYPMVDVREGHHQLSHHRNDAKLMEKIQRIDQFLVGEFAYFLKQLESIQEGTGNLLDHVMVMYGSGLSDGNRHWHHDLPIVLAGGGAGTIRAGRHLRLPGEVPLNNLFLSMLDRVGANVDKLGDSSGRLTAIDI